MVSCGTSYLQGHRQQDLQKGREVVTIPHSYLEGQTGQVKLLQETSNPQECTHAHFSSLTDTHTPHLPTAITECKERDITLEGKDVEPSLTLVFYLGGGGGC